MDLLENVLTWMVTALKWASIAWIAYGIVANVGPLLHHICRVSPQTAFGDHSAHSGGYFVLPGGVGLGIAYLAETTG
jgi:hypothetical protein